MTDTPMPPLPSADELAALTPEGKASYETTLSRYNPAHKDAIAAHFRGAGAAPNPSPAVAADLGRRTLDVHHAHADNGLTHTQAAAGLEVLRKHWTGDPAALDAVAAQYDIGQVDAQAKAAAENAATEREAAVIAQLSPPAANGYRLQYPSSIAATLDILAKAEAGGTDVVAANERDVMKFDSAVKSALGSAGAPPVQAQALLDALIRTVNTYAGMKPAAHALRHAEEGHRFKTLSGSTENIRLAQATYERLPAAFRAKFDAAKGFHSAETQMALANIGRMIEERERRSKMN